MSVRVCCLYLDEVPAAVNYTITTLLNIRCRTYLCRSGFVQIPTSVYKTWFSVGGIALLTFYRKRDGSLATTDLGLCCCLISLQHGKSRKNQLLPDSEEYQSVNVCPQAACVVVFLLLFFFVKENWAQRRWKRRGGGGEQTCQASGDICIILQDGGLVDGLIWVGMPEM